MSIVTEIASAANSTIKELYQAEFISSDIIVNLTKPEFDDDYTIVLFNLIKQLKKSPEAAGNEIGNHLLQKHPGLFTSFNVIKGFLNLSISDSYWIDFLQKNYNSSLYGISEKNGRRIVVEYSSPNSNKPLHLGHLRNNFLGWSAAEILKTKGNEIIKTCIVNDRGVHICKSMLAWKLFANGATPESTGIKGDHFVGDYYVKFNDEYKKQVEELIASGIKKEVAEKDAPIMKAAQQMLIDWEAGKPDIVELWRRMNSWVYKGFEETYKRIGSDFDKIYYESETYLLGKDFVEEGLRKGVFYKTEDGGIWIDLRAEGLDEKIVQRKDGTGLYITQDIGLAVNKYEEYKFNQSIYVVGDEQNYHFKVLKLICQKLAIPAAQNMYHLNYGMVELPGGKMKSREGTVVDADDLIDEMLVIAQEKTKDLGKVQDFTKEELHHLYNVIALGALKFFLLRVDPKKRMVFNPEESIDFHGFTGSFVQYSYARIKSIFRKLSGGSQQSAVGSQQSAVGSQQSSELLPLEKDLIIQLEQFPAVIDEAAIQIDPSKIAIYVFNLAKTFNSFYTKHSIANAESEEKKTLRLQIAQLTANVIKTAMKLLGIDVPERM
ncbi:MAG: arginine--tRNA ligase [Parafilimonas sp.]